jgi:hypothetical protein
MQRQHTELAARREIEQYVHPQFIWVWEMVRSGNRSTIRRNQPIKYSGGPATASITPDADPRMGDYEVFF